MSILYAATLGERSQAITVALDRLMERYTYAQIAILHTDTNGSRMEKPRDDLRGVLESDYGDLPVRWHEIGFTDGTPMLDIDNQHSAESYYQSVLQTLYDYKRDGYTIHLMVAGGRKAMSIYAMLAATVVFEQNRDRVFTVLSSDDVLRNAGWHIPSGMREQVQIVHMPLLTARLAPSSGTPPMDMLTRRFNPRDDFINNKLTPQERELVMVLMSNPMAQNKTLAQMMNKGIKTIETQMGSIYDKMKVYFDNGERIENKRLALIELLQTKG